MKTTMVQDTVIALALSTTVVSLYTVILMAAVGL